MSAPFTLKTKIVGATPALIARHRIAAWREFEITIGHPRLNQLADRVKRERLAGNQAAAAVWGADLHRLFLLLTAIAAGQCLQSMQRKRRLADGILTVLFICSTFLYAKVIYDAVLIDLMLVALLLGSSLFFTAREDYLHGVMAASYRSREAAPHG